MLFFVFFFVLFCQNYRLPFLNAVFARQMNLRHWWVNKYLSGMTLSLTINMCMRASKRKQRGTNWKEKRERNERKKNPKTVENSESSVWSHERRKIIATDLDIVRNRVFDRRCIISHSVYLSPISPLLSVSFCFLLSRIFFSNLRYFSNSFSLHRVCFRV